MKVGYIQFQPQFGNIKANVSKALQIMEDCTTDLLVLPELFNTGYLFTDFKELPELAEKIPDGFTCQQLMEAAKRWRIYIVAGILEEDQSLFYNSAVLIGEGGYIDHYRKIHLFDEEKFYFAPGDKPFKVYDIGTAKIGIMVCYDWIYPESMRILSLLGAEVICHPANLVLPYCPKVMPARCFENHVFAITANRIGSDVKGDKSVSFIGQSMVAAPDGSVIKRAGPDNEVMDIVYINPQDARNKKIKQHNDLFEDRRPEMYAPLTMNKEELAKIQPVDAAKTGFKFDDRFRL